MEITIRGGATYDLPNADEIRQIVSEQVRTELRGVKWMRLPVLSGTATNSAITLGDKQGAPLGPDQGYAWNIRRIVVDGLTSGATPDIINMYRNAVTGQPPLWQFNGNNFGYTFSKGEMTLSPGDALKFASVGTFAATGLVRVTGEVVEVPAEMLAKIV
jgi:hypothetical protein